MDGMFEMAQALRRSHCDKQNVPGHECVGEVTIKRGQVCLSCSLCGKGEEIPGWDSSVAAMLAKVFEAAGISWDSLDMESKRQAVIRFKREFTKDTR